MKSEKYKICAVVQILETIRFILFRDESFTRCQSNIQICNDSFTRGQSNMRRLIYERSVKYATIHLREVSQICDDNSFTRGQPLISVTGHWRSLSYDNFRACKKGTKFCGWDRTGMPPFYTWVHLCEYYN